MIARLTMLRVSSAVLCTHYGQVNSSCDHGRYPGMTLPALLASFAACPRQSTQHSSEGRREPPGTAMQLLKARAITRRDGWRPTRAGGGEGRAAAAGNLGPDARRGQHAVAPQRPPLHALREGRPVDAPRCTPPLSTALTLVCCSGIKLSSAPTDCPIPTSAPLPPPIPEASCRPFSMLACMQFKCGSGARLLCHFRAPLPVTLRRDVKGGGVSRSINDASAFS